MMTNSNYENAQKHKNIRGNHNSERVNSRGRYGGNKDGGGFRIRLSENEMKSVKTIQETFNLKSTVAVLGFSVRTLSEMINDEQFSELIKKYLVRNKNNSFLENKNNRDENINSSAPNPFARPPKIQNPKGNSSEGKSEGGDEQ